jgi:hypothetical protein
VRLSEVSCRESALIGFALVVSAFPIAAARAQQRPSLEERIDAQQKLNERQREQLEEQAAELEELRKQVEEQRREDERVDELEED